MRYKFKKDGIELAGVQTDGFKKEVSAEIEEITKMIEADFGPMDRAYPLTINFNSQNAIVTVVNENSITINLPIYAMDDNSGSKYQRRLNLSHELIHTITPSRDASKATFLDEGLAVVFSEQYTGCDSHPSQERYALAKKLVSQLLKIDKEIIKKLRNKYPNKMISDYTAQDILGEISLMDLAQNITKRFS